MYWYELLFLWTQCYVILTVLNVCTSIGWIIFSHSHLHVTHDKISVCLAIWLIWWTNIFVIKMINTPGHVLSPGWPLCKRSGLTLIEGSQHAYSSYQASSLPFNFYLVILATWCNWLDFYWCWIKFCLSLSLSLKVLQDILQFIYDKSSRLFHGTDANIGSRVIWFIDGKGKWGCYQHYIISN